MAQAAGASRVILAGIDRDEKVRLPRARDLRIDHIVNVSRQIWVDWWTT